jgi:hypothetical protein
MAFCNQNVPTSLTTQELQATFGNGVTQSILPTTPQTRNEEGLLTNESVTSIVDDLFRTGKVSKSKVPVDSIKQEYCFYETRYKYVLKQMIAKLQSGYNKNDQAAQTVMRADLQIAQTLNQKLSDITIITAAIAQKLRSQSSASSAVEAVSNELNKKAAVLKKQGEIINSNEGAANLYKEMMRYSREKVRATDNLLSLYSFLNIFAFGMLVYIYMSM